VRLLEELGPPPAARHRLRLGLDLAHRLEVKAVDVELAPAEHRVEPASGLDADRAGAAAPLLAVHEAPRKVTLR
jgi:hypothetical protein